jgi:hypothetical protein
MMTDEFANTQVWERPELRRLNAIEAEGAPAGGGDTLVTS